MSRGECCKKCQKKKTSTPESRAKSKLLDVKELERALEERAKNFCWLMTIFILTCSPGIFNSMHIIVYAFLSDNPKVWCDIEVLRKANWTNEQIRNISSVEPNEDENCFMYGWDYQQFGKVGYKQALDFVKKNEKPNKISCDHYQYEHEKSTIVSEWDLVCNYRPMKSFAQVAIIVGKLIGAFMCGMFADKFGRKKCFAYSCILYMIAGPIAAIVPYYYLFLFVRLTIGIAGSGVYESGYTLLTELTVKKHRTRLGCLYNISYSVGLVILPVLAYYSKTWRELQLYITLPAFILLINCWLLPESPRWLITQGRPNHAEYVVYGKIEGGSTINVDQPRPKKTSTIAESVPGKVLYGEMDQIWYKRILTLGMKVLKLFVIGELRNRILICYFGWFVAALSYFVIALNADNFAANKYIYIALNGVAEAPGYVFPMLVLSFVGRKLTGVVLFLITGFALLIILLVKNSIAIMAIALTGRFCMSAVFAVIILHTSELFPTSNRNSAIGTSLTMSQLGGIAAPFIVDMLGHIIWYLPSTLCGVICTMAGLLILFLPETRNKLMMDTLKDVEAIDDKEKVSFRNCCNFV